MKHCSICTRPQNEVLMLASWRQYHFCYTCIELMYKHMKEKLLEKKVIKDDNLKSKKAN